MQGLKVANPNRRLRGVQLGATIGLPLLFLLFLLSGLRSASLEQAWAAPEPRTNNTVTYPAPAGSITLAALPGWDSVKVIDPVVITDSGLYKMWYTGLARDGTFRVGYATSPDGVMWTKYVGNPVLNVGTGGTWDSDVVRVNAVIKDGSTYRMWYNGNGHRRIGYATSPDGISWTKYAGNSVLDADPSPSWEEGGILHAGVISDAGVYKMWYTGVGASGFAHIGYATSTNVISWTKSVSNPVLEAGPSAWEAQWVFDPCVISDGVSYKMWYSGLDVPFGSGTETLRIGLATSPDGISWTKSASNPVLDVNPTGWDSQTVTGPWVIFDGNTYHMWYHGGTTGFADEMIGYATSVDGISWTKYAGNPVLRPSQLAYLPVVVKNSEG